MESDSNVTLKHQAATAVFKDPGSVRISVCSQNSNIISISYSQVNYMDPNLYEAAAKGKIEPFEKIAADELRDIVTQKSKNTVLHVNIESQINNGEYVSTEFVEWILETCPSLLLQVNAKGDAPLHVAASFGQLDFVQVLIVFAKKQPKEIESGVETVRQMLWLTNNEQNTALHEAVRHPSFEIVKMLIEADPDVPYSTNGSGETPLYIAAANGSDDIVAEILNSRPSAAHQGPNGKTALHAAVHNYTTRVIENLLEKNSSLSKIQDKYGWTPLHEAAYSGRVSASKLLIEHDESAAYIGDKDRKMTPLLLAAGRRHLSVVNAIICQCPGCCEYSDERGWNFLHFAVVSVGVFALERPFFMRLMDQTDVNGNTPLHVLAAVCQDFSYSMVPPVGHKFNYEAVNNHGISVRQVISHGSPDLEQEIKKLSEDVGRGQYPEGILKVNTDKKKVEAAVKDERQIDTLVATLIATVTFAAAFSLPGGNWDSDGSKPGTAILRRHTAFQAFVISDVIAMVLSLSAVFFHFLFPVQLIRQNVLLVHLVRGFILLSLLAMAIAFAAGTYAVLAPSFGLAIATCLLGLSFIVFVFFAISMLGFFAFTKISHLKDYPVILSTAIATHRLFLGPALFKLFTPFMGKQVFR